MKKIKLRKKSTDYRVCIFFVTVVFMFSIIIFFVYFLGKKVNEKILAISEIEVSRISKTIINESVNRTVSDNVDIKDLFHIEKDTFGNIQMIDFDSKEVNEMLDIINENVKKYFIELENGSSMENTNNLITNTLITSSKKGIVFEIPIGMASNNPFLSNIGPKIPVKVSLVGEMESNIKTEIEEYGINNSVLKIIINITVSEQIILPLVSKKVTVDNDVPIAIKMIQGEIPEYYINDFLT